FFFSSRRRHTRCLSDWSSDVCSSDLGLAFVRDPEAHRAAMARSAAYLQRSATDRDNYEWTPEFSRRARGFSVYAALRSLGRAGRSEERRVGKEGRWGWGA